MPEKSGMDAPPLAGPAASVTVCARTDITAPAANATNKGKSRRWTLMISSVHDLPVLIRIRTILAQKPKRRTATL
jgi:hypothetical protein